MALAAALALAATHTAAQGGGGGGSGGSGGAGQGGAAGAQGGAPTGGGADASGAQEQRGDQAAAAQQAPSVTGMEGAGGKRPHPQAQEVGGDRRFGEAPAQPSGQAGRPADETSLGRASEVTGRVAAVNASDHELAIDAGESTTQLKVAPDAQITIDGKRAAFQDIRQGAHVRASLERSGDGMHASKLEVTSTAAKK